MKTFFYIAALTFVCFSCQKKVRSTGIVYSKYHYPVANITVRISEYTTGKDAPLSSRTTTTDNSGKFIFNYTTAKNRYFSLGVECDSGRTHKSYLSRTDLEKYDLQLY